MANGKSIIAVTVAEAMKSRMVSNERKLAANDPAEAGRNSSRILPALNDSKYVDSLFEIKTVLEKNEADDGRPILFESHVDLPGCFSVLGGKIDNIYDVLNKLDTLELQ